MPIQELLARYSALDLRSSKSRYTLLHEEMLRKSCRKLRHANSPRTAGAETDIKEKLA